jgi:predicted AlkP superfamily pyrophosphatase or phosphodiesterase
MGLALAAVFLASPATAQDYVIHISVDGLRPDAVTALGEGAAPNFHRFRKEGAFTDNARTDFDFTITLPNHTCQLTGRPVFDRFGEKSGHQYTSNGDPAPGQTLASTAGYYIASAFDVAHDHGLKTGLYATKSKFSLYKTSFDAKNGAPDKIGPDDGNNKIDVYFNRPGDSPALVRQFRSNMSKAESRTHYTFVHFHDADTAGHAKTWDVAEPPPAPYLVAVRSVDGYLGEIFNVVDSVEALRGRTAIVLTADHGGMAGTPEHSTASNQQDYTIPLYAWGAGVSKGDLYALNHTSRLNPAGDRPLYSAPVPPIRNGDVANLAMTLLRVGPVPGSSINAKQDLKVARDPATASLNSK